MQGARKMAWTESRTNTLRRLWAEGLSATQIARELGGVTRNAVIGKVHRLGLPSRATASRSNSKQSQPRKPAAPTVLQPRAFALGGGCRYPIGDPQEAGFHMCGEPRHGGAYCTAHAQLCYVPLTHSQRQAYDRLANWIAWKDYRAAGQAA